MEAQSVCGQKTRCSFRTTTQPFNHAYSFWVSKRMSEISKILRALWCTVSQWWHHLLLLYMQGIWTRLSTVQQSKYSFATHLTLYTTAYPVQLLWSTAKKHSVNCPLQQCFTSCAYWHQIVSSILTLEKKLFWPFFGLFCPLKFDLKIITHNHVRK